MEKLVIKMKSDMQNLEKMIESFIYTFSPSKIIQKFRYSSSIFQSIDKEVIKEIILYVVCIQLSSFVSDKEKERQKTLLKNLRNQYWKFSVSIWKKSLNFQIWMVFITKIICYFYQQNFTDVLINQKIEAQIYIILIHTFIGLTVNIKCYEILNSKYYTTKQNSRTVVQPKKAILKKQKMLKKMNSQCSNIFSQGKKQETELDTNRYSVQPQITQQYAELKKFLSHNLRVNSLPKVKNSKKTIQSMYHTQIGYRRSIDLKAYENQMKKKALRSTQTSTSFQNQLFVNNIAYSTQTKSFKIPHRIQLKSNYVSYNRRDAKRQLNTSLPSKDKEKCQVKTVGFHNWKKVVKKLKMAGCEESMKLQLSSLYPNRQKKEQYQKQNFVFELESPVNNSNLSERQQQKVCEKTNEVKQIFLQSPPTKLDFFTRDFKEITVQNISYLDRKSKKTTQMKSHQLRIKKAEFEKLNEQRSKRIQYSMFLLPNQQQKFQNLR